MNDVSNNQSSDANIETDQNNINDGTEKKSRFKPGQILRFVRVRFPGHAKSFAFLVGNRNLMYGQKVVAMSDRGMAVGYINSFIYNQEFNEKMLPIHSINKVATQDDIDKDKESYKEQKRVENICHELIETHKLDMNLTHVEFTQFGKKVVFYFTAPARVDFRGLVRDLVSKLKLRIELRQISVRDRAAAMGAMGPCGRELCCSSFLSQYGNVSIKMAKNQNLSLNYSKLNGVCGQLKCCLQYEDEVYENKRKSLPKENSIIKTVNGDIAKVRKLHLLVEQFDAITEKGRIKRFTANQYKETLNDYQFPRSFENIVDETSQIIGLEENAHEKTLLFERDMAQIKNDSKLFARDTFNQFEELSSSEYREGSDEVKLEELPPVPKQHNKNATIKTDDSSDLETAKVNPRHPRKNQRHNKNFSRKARNQNQANKKTSQESK